MFVKQTIILLASLFLFGCVSSRMAGGTGTGYGYTQEVFSAPTSTVKTASIELLSDLKNSSHPQVPADISVSGLQLNSGWVYSEKHHSHLRRNYQLTLVPRDNGTLVIVEIIEEKKSQNQWNPELADTQAYRKVISQLGEKIRDFP